jgi:hypothetical protein
MLKESGGKCLDLIAMVKKFFHAKEIGTLWY